MDNWFFFFQQNDAKKLPCQYKSNEYFRKIGPELVSSVDNHLKSPCQLSFQLRYTTPDNIEKLIGDLKPMSSVSYDNLSSQLLKDIKDIISRPLSKIINQFLCSGIFPSKASLVKFHRIDSYCSECVIPQFYICARST